MEETVATSTSEAISSRATASEATRWGQLIFGIICMVMIANLQYGWTLFVNPIDEKHHWGRAAIQVAFTIFVLTETWLVPVEGWLGDRFGCQRFVEPLHRGGDWRHRCGRGLWHVHRQCAEVVPRSARACGRAD